MTVHRIKRIRSVIIDNVALFRRFYCYITYYLFFCFQFRYHPLHSVVYLSKYASRRQCWLFEWFIHCKALFGGISLLHVLHSDPGETEYIEYWVTSLSILLCHLTVISPTFTTIQYFARVSHKLCSFHNQSLRLFCVIFILSKVPLIFILWRHLYVLL